MNEQETIPLVEWNLFVEQFNWVQGEHVGLIGPTGSGKTHLAFWLLPLRKFVVIFATKPKDTSLDNFGQHQGYKKLREWTDMSVKRAPRRIIWPDARSLESDTIQAKVFTNAISRIYRQGGWTLYIDELWYLCQILGMTRQVKMILQQARSMKISLIVASQRPAWVPVEVYDQSTHLFFWRDNDITNLRRMGGIGAQDSRIIIDTVCRLPKYHVLYVNTRTGEMAITKPPEGKY